MPDDFDEEELPEGLEGKKYGVIKTTEKSGKAFFKFLKDFEKMSERISDMPEDNAKTHLEMILATAMENARVCLSRDFYAMPFAIMHRTQHFPPEYDEPAKQLCGLISSDLMTLKILSDTLGDSVKELRDHMEPILKKKLRENRRKEGSVVAPSTGENAGEDEGPRTNVLDFAERRGRVKDKPRSTTYH